MFMTTNIVSLYLKADSVIYITFFYTYKSLFSSFRLEMVYEYKRKNPPQIPLDEAKIRDVIDGRISKRKAAKEVGISEWTIRQRMKNPGFTPAPEGGHTSLPYESDGSYIRCLK